MVERGDPRFLTLMSNNDEKYFPKNSASNFRNLVDPYYINGGPGTPANLKIALRSCFIPSKYTNVLDGKCWLVGVKKDDDEIDFEKVPFSVNPGFYNSPATLCDALNENLKDEIFGGTKKTMAVWFSMSKKWTNNAQIKFIKLTFHVQLSDDVAKILGFAPGHIIDCPDEPALVVSPYTAQIHTNKTELFIYLSSIKNSCVGNKGYPLLEIVPWSPDVEAVHKPTQFIEKNRLFWHRIETARTEEMAIQITDSAGEEMKFFGANSIFSFELSSSP